MIVIMICMRFLDYVLVIGKYNVLRCVIVKQYLVYVVKYLFDGILLNYRDL